MAQEFGVANACVCVCFARGLDLAEAQSVELEDAPRGVDAMRAVDAEDEILPSEVLNLNEPFYELVRSSMVEECSAGAGNDHGEVMPSFSSSCAVVLRFLGGGSK